jgi:4-amino-4-deoxy-L-arabinose transferase-like glycosyltransferase
MRALRAIPAACLACAAIGFAHAALWAVLTPPFHVPDEPNHVGYVQYVAEKGRAPNQSDGQGYSDEQAQTIILLPFDIELRPTWDRQTRDILFHKLDEKGLTRSASGQAGSSTNYPPLYYAAEAIPYRLAYHANFLDRLFYMRLLSALMAGLTVGFVFLFLRELLPSTPWAWTVGALAVAFQPVFAFMGGGVNNDNLLYTAAAALTWLVARAFRRGLTPGLGVAIGLAAAAGVMSKQSMFGILPGAALGLLLVTWRMPAERRRGAVLGLVAAGLILIVPSVVWYEVSEKVYHRYGATTTGGLTTSTVNSYVTLRGQFTYLWQTVLPLLPGMDHQRSHQIWWNVFTKGFIGRFGWFEFSFQPWVYWLGGAILGGLAALALAALERARAVVRARWAELLTYATMALGMFVLVEVAAYRFQAVNGQAFEQTRYLFPLLAFYGAMVALAVRGVGRRWGPTLGAVLVVLMMGHSLFAMFLNIARWYA